jgi:predicted lipid-binding transport protein (Tim44 family)
MISGMSMESVWRRPVAGALMAICCVRSAWATESVAEGSAWGGMAMWVGIGALVLLGVVLLGRLLRTRSESHAAMGVSAQPGLAEGEQAAALRSYSLKNVGNDASARPWERDGPDVDVGTAAGSQGGVMTDAMLSNGPSLAVPAGFDTGAFLHASKANFVALQDAWNRSDIASLRAMMTDGMLEQIQGQLSEREVSREGAATEVVMLDARLLGIDEQDNEFMASVEFSGMLREDPSAGPNPFRELWSITRPKAGDAGWLVAGVQSLQ